MERLFKDSWNFNMNNYLLCCQFIMNTRESLLTGFLGSLIAISWVVCAKYPFHIVSHVIWISLCPSSNISGGSQWLFQTYTLVLASRIHNNGRLYYFDKCLLETQLWVHKSGFFVVHQVSSTMPSDVTVHTDRVFKMTPWNAVSPWHNDRRKIEPITFNLTKMCLQDVMIIPSRKKKAFVFYLLLN